MTFEYRSTAGFSRDLVTEDESSPSVFVADERRRRSLYFDGRFLAARDLTRDQSYFLARQADLGAALFGGVVTGLHVRSDETGSRLLIQPGHGITPSGELVLVRDTAAENSPPVALSVDLADVASIERLDATFGLSRRPGASVRNRTGTYVVALRPVEYTANPIAQYPTSLKDRSLQAARDGDIVEAVAISLVPFDLEPSSGGLDDPRARAARAVFFQGNVGKLPVEALPIAMVGITRGVIQWVDEWIVRRELTGEPSAFSFVHRAVRTAFVRQYLQHLTDVSAARARNNRTEAFSATEHFLVLPPAGRVPHGVVALRNGVLEQRFFPPEVDVDLSIVPRDEIPSLLEDAAALPAIDLSAPPEALDGLRVSILISVDRSEIVKLKTELGTLDKRVSAEPNARLLRQRPLRALQSLRRINSEPVSLPVEAVTAAWTRELERARGGVLWYVRKRNLPVASEVAPRITPSSQLIDLAGIFAEASGETERLKQALRTRPDAEVRKLLEFLIRHSMAFQYAMVMSGFITEIEDGLPVTTRYHDKLLGTGIKALETWNVLFKNSLDIRITIAKAQVVPEIDTIVRTGKVNVGTFGPSLLALADNGESQKIRTIVMDYFPASRAP